MSNNLSPIKYFQLLLLVYLTNQFACAQVVINEISSTNNKFIVDEDNDYPDWIELYNTANIPVSLQDWCLKEIGSLNNWILPNLTIPGFSHLLIYASGKNRNETSDYSKINHWETAIFESDEWKYFVGTQEPKSNWNQIDFDLSTWKNGIGGFGYGDDDDNTLLPEMTLSVYYQKVFFVSDTNAILDGILSMDYDDSFIAYLNGVEIARSNITGSPAPYNAFSITDHEAVLFSGGKPESFIIKKKVLRSLLKIGDNKLSIQINNTSESSSDLSGRTWLHFGINSDKRYFKDNPIWFDGSLDSAKGKELHTNFKIKFNEVISLFDHNKILVDSIRVNALFGHSLARIPDGGEWCYAETPTPKFKNMGICLKNYSVTPSLSPAPGFFFQNVSIQMLGTNCFYTTDGTDPTISSRKYTGPISITKTTIVRLRNFEQGKLPSEIISGIYFLDQSTSLPVVSISSNPRNLFNDGTNGPAVYDKAKGFTQSDKTTCNIQFFDKKHNLVFQENASFTPVGNYSLDFGQKSIQFVFDEDYGALNEKVPNIFNLDKPHIEKIHGFRVRNMDDDAGSTRMRDLISNRMGTLTSAGSGAYQNVVVYINGVYWGHYAAREILDKYFMKDNYLANIDSVDMVKTAYSVKPDYFPEEGSTKSFFEISDFVINSDLSDSFNFSKVANEIDINNLVDYYANEIYNNNQDWYPSEYFNNIRLAKATQPDIKWKYILWDMGVSQGNGTGINEDLLTMCIENPRIANRYSSMIKSMLQNQEFKVYFINRFADLLNEVWNTSRLHKMIEDNSSEIASEIMPNHFRWNSVDSNSWRSNVEYLKQFHTLRPNVQRSHIHNYFKLKKQVEISLDVFPINAGVIRISSIIPDKLPWEGTYFNGNPVQITAIANPGYSFSHWASNGIIVDTNIQSINIDVSNNGLFKAFFTGVKNSLDLEISEINYNSDSTISSGDWIELHNTSSTDVDLTNFTIHDDQVANAYKFPVNTIIGKKNYLVLSSDLVKFKSRNSKVTNVLGPINFDLNNQGESITLKDRSNQIVISMKFSDSLSWPCTPDGYGRTMELKTSGSNLNDPESWFDGCIGGSPGVVYSPCNHSLIISEINYKSSITKDAGDWIELYNNQITKLDISNYSITDSRKNNYTIPLNTSLLPNEYLVIVQNLTKFKFQFPAVNNYIGPMNYGFDGNGDVINIYNSKNELIYSICYNDVFPFPKEADGAGFTLELKDYNANVNDGRNWFAGCLGGSPGYKYDPNCGTVSTSNISETTLILSPNPTSYLLNLYTDKSHIIANVKIFNALGKLIRVETSQKSDESKMNIDISNFNNGVYWVQCTTKKNLIFTKQFIVQRD